MFRLTRSFRLSIFFYSQEGNGADFLSIPLPSQFHLLFLPVAWRLRDLKFTRKTTIGAGADVSIRLLHFSPCRIRPNRQTNFMRKPNQINLYRLLVRLVNVLALKIRPENAVSDKPAYGKPFNN